MDEDAVFSELTVDMEDTIVVAFTQRSDEGTPEVDLAGTTDYDAAIAVAVKGIFMLILDSMGFWESDEDNEQEEDA